MSFAEVRLNEFRWNPFLSEKWVTVEELTRSLGLAYCLNSVRSTAGIDKKDRFIQRSFVLEVNLGYLERNDILDFKTFIILIFASISRYRTTSEALH